MKKKSIAVISVLIGAVVLTGCGNDSGSSSEKETTPTASDVATTAETTENKVVTTTSANKKSKNSGSSSDNNKVTTNSDKSNEYGFYPVETPIYTSISVASLNGVWYDTSTFSNYLTIYSDADDLYSGTWEYEYEVSGFRNGYIELEQLGSDKSSQLYFNFYEADGTLWESIVATGEIPLDNLYREDSDSPAYTRCENSEASGENMGVYDGGDYYLGSWVCDRASMYVTTGDTAGRYVVAIDWSNSSDEMVHYEYNCKFTEDDGLISDSGTRTVTSYANGGEPEVIEINDASASFYLMFDEILWNNMTEDNVAGMSFKACN